MEKEVTLSVTQVMTDGQDGGYSLSFYKDEETAKRLIVENRNKWARKKLTVDEVDWDDEYENGYFSHETLKFILNDDGTLALPNDELYVGHFGQ